MKTSLHAGFWSICIVALAFPANTPYVAAQVGTPTINIFPPAPRSLRQNLVRAKKAIEEDRFSDAVAELGVVLTGTELDQPVGVGDENQDFFIELPGQSGTQTSLKAEAQRMLGTLPPRGRELFELQFGADARALLESAVQDADVNELNEVVRRYFHTTAGYEAALLLGRLHLDHGRPLAAALCLQRVANVPNVAARFEPELSLLLAACWQLARQSSQAQSTLAGLPVRFPHGQVRLGDAELRELPSTQDAVAWLAEHFRTISTADAEIGQWPLFRGNPSRNAARSGGLPLKRSRWQVPLVIDAHDRGLIEELRVGFVEQGSPVMPVVQPLAVGNVVLMRSSERLVGIDFQTGKRIWEYPFGDLSPEEELQNSNPLMPPQNGRATRLTTLRERLWQDTPFGQVSSDGNSVYLLDGMRQTAPQTPPRMRNWNRGRAMGFPVELSILQNELVALDLQREGYMMWVVGGADGGEEPRLAGVFFLGPPLPLFGSLYLIAELKGELRLVVLDAATGKQQWSQQLAHVEAILGMDEQVRRFSGATPSFADGVLVCPTSAGAIVAVDIATRHLLWGYQYSSNREGFGRQPFMQPFPMQPTFPSNRWQDASVTIAEGSVLVTPAESDMLICLDLLTGKPRWEPLPRNRDLADMLYVAGIYDGNAVLVAKDRVVALRLKDGKLDWKEPAKLQNVDGEMPSGRGFLSDHHYYLPTTKSDLVKIDLRDGKIAERAKTDHVLGNLICFRDEIVSVAADRAATFYQIEPLRKNVEMKLDKSPDDAWALARQGELLVHDGRTAEALGVLHKAHDRNRQDEGVRSLLVDTFLAALQDDFGKHGAMAAEIADLVDNDPQRARYLMLVAAGYHRAGDLVASADHYAKLVRLTVASAKKIPAGEAFSLIAPDVNSSVRTDRFLSARLDELYRTGDTPVREHLDALVRELGVQANAGSVAELRHFLQLCGFHAAADDQRVNLARKLIETGDLLEAELALAPLLRRDNSPLGGQALALATRIYASAKKPRMLAAAYAQLRSTWGDVPVLNGKTGRQLSEEAVAINLDYPTAGQEWPWGLTKITDSRDAARQTMRSIHLCFSLLERRGAALDQLKLQLDGQGNIHLRDRNGTDVLRLPQLEARTQIDAGLWRTAADDHLLFAAVNGQIVAIDTLRPRSNEIESSLWRETLWSAESDSVKALPREHRNPFDPSHLMDYRWGDAMGRPIASVGPMTASGACFQKIRAITCVDPLTGTTLWSRNDFDQGCELFGDDELVFIQTPIAGTPKSESTRSATTAADAATVVAPLDIECSVVSAVDGRLLGKRRLPAPARRWTSRGRNVLAWEQKESDIRLFLHDVNRQADVWSESFPAGSRGCLIDNDSVAVLQPNGRLVIRSLTGDTEKLDTAVQPTNGLVSIQVLPSSHQLLLIVNDSQPGSPEPDTGRRLIQQVLAPVNGRIFALDRVTGRSLWMVPAIVRGYGMLPNQPEDVPALWFLRPGTTPSNQFGSSNARLDVLCIDRRTGCALLEKTDVASHANSFDVIADVRKNEVTLALPQVQYTLRFTTDPQPPAPPFQHSRTGNRVDAALEKLGDFIETFKDVLIPIPRMDPFK